MQTYDVIVIGLGGMGSATACHLARRGVRVLGLEQHHPFHDLGSSHGDTRIIRKAYFEHPDYVPLLIRAYQLWDELAATSKTALFERCGLLLAGPRSGHVVPGLYRAARAHGLPLETFSEADLAERYPMFDLPSDRYESVFEADAGYLDIHACLKAHLDAAEQAGATLLYGQRVVEWTPDGRAVVVKTGADTFSAERLVICGGSWSASILVDLSIPLTVRRKVQLWFATEDGRYDGAPVYGVEASDGFFYGFPAIASREIKVAHHTGGANVADPDRVDRLLLEDDVAPVRRFIGTHLRGVTDRVMRHSVCLYTMTPDEHFILDRHPNHANVCFAAGFSGHGFKFCSVVGSVMADLALTGSTEEPIEFLRLSRFQQ